MYNHLYNDINQLKNYKNSSRKPKNIYTLYQKEKIIMK